MKELYLEPTIADENVIAHFTDAVTVSKNLTVKIPQGYQAVLFIDGKSIARIPAGMEKKIVDFGKQYLNKQGRVAFVRNSVSSDMAWGFGNIRVNNERLQEAYTVGANGKYSVEIYEIGKLLNGLNGETSITTETIRDKTIATIKSVGTAVLAKYFANTNISIFEISAHITEIRKEMTAALMIEKAFTALGLKLHNLTVESIHIPDEDLAIIKERINTAPVDADHRRAHAGFESDGYKDFSDIRREIEKALDERFEKSSAELQERLLAGIDEKLQAVTAKQQERPSEAAFDIETLIENAQSENDYVIPASMIYTSIEDSLINRFHLPHHDRKYVIPYTEYLELAETAKINGQYILKRETKDGWEVLPVRVDETYNDGTPKTVEMYPVVRFLKIGLTPEEAKYAEKIGVVINRIRHPSPENKDLLQKFFEQQKQTKKAFLLQAVQFLKEKNLYNL